MRFLKQSVFPVLFVMLASSQAYAASESDVTSGLVRLLTWAQGIALLLCVLGFMKAGMMLNDGDQSAPKALKWAALGTAVVALAVVIVEVIKRTLLGSGGISV